MQAGRDHVPVPTSLGAEDQADFADFLERVNAVDATVKGLADGTVDVAQADSVSADLGIMTEAQEQAKAARAAARDEEVAEAKRAVTRKKIGFAGLWCNKCKIEHGEADEECGKCGGELMGEAARQEDLNAKVEVLKQQRQKRQKARQRFAEYQVSHPKKTGTGTDYSAWDLWTPDEDDEDLPAVTPDTPEFRAMEKDIEERYERRKERNLLGDKAKADGNSAFKKKQYSEALRLYDSGCSYRKDDRALYLNRAFAHMKLENWSSAVEDCDKSLYMAEHFECLGEAYNGAGAKPMDKLCAKAYMRRAICHAARSEFAEALEDLQEANLIEKDSKHVLQLLEKAKDDLEEYKKQLDVQRDVAQALAAQSEGDGGSATGKSAEDPFAAIVEGVAALKKGAAAQLVGEAELAELSIQLRRIDAALSLESHLIAIRDQGGLEPLALLLEHDGIADAVLSLMRKLSLNTANREQLCNTKNKQFMPRLVALASPALESASWPHALATLAACSSVPAARSAVSSMELTAVVAQVFHGALSGNKQTAQSVEDASSGLGNFCTEADFKASLGGQKWCPDLVNRLVAQTLSPSGKVAQKSANALANMAADVGLREHIATEDRLPVLVASLAANFADGGNKEVVNCVMGVMLNCSLDAPVQQRLATVANAVSTLVTVLKGTDAGLCNRAASVLCRVAKAAGVPDTLAQMGAVGCAIDLLAAHQADAAVRDSPSFAMAEACIRLLAVVLQKSDAGVKALRDEKAKKPEQLLVSLLGTWSKEDAKSTVPGNAALTIGFCARNAGCQKAFARADAVAALLNICHRHADKAVKKNAGVALAKLAQHPPNLVKLRELHGIEILHAYAGV